MLKRVPILWPLLLFLSLSAWFIAIGQWRFVAGDEGFYLAAGRLVQSGKMPYTDFFYPQMPLLPYLYAAWFKVFGASWLAGRHLTALFSVFTGLGVFYFTYQNSARKTVAALAVLLYAVCDLTISYYSITKTYAPAACFLIWALVLLQSAAARGPAVLFSAGVLTALAVQMRLYYLVVVPLLLWELYRRGSQRAVRGGLLLLSGFMVGALPAILLLIADPESFLFNNITYHSLRNRVGLIGGMHQKIKALRYALGYAEHTGYITYQFFLLFIFASGYLGLMWKRTGRMPLLGWIILLLLIVSFLPTPVYVQYLAVLVPLTAAGAALFYGALCESLKGVKAFALHTAAAVLVLVYMAPLRSEVERCLVSGFRVSGVYEQHQRYLWRPRGMAAIAEAIDRIAHPGEKVLVSWPGYLVDSHAQILPGLENHFGVTIGKKLSPEQRRRFRVMDQRELKDLVRQGAARVLVLGYRDKHSALRRLALAGNYQMEAQVGKTAVFVKRSNVLR